MIDIRDHGGSFGGGMPSTLSIMSVKDKITFPQLNQIQHGNTNASFIFDPVGDYLYFIKYSSSSMCFIDVYRKTTMEYIRGISVNAPYEFIRTCLMLPGDILFVSIYSGNAGDSWNMLDTYNMSTGSRISRVSNSWIITEYLTHNSTHISGLHSSKSTGVRNFKRIRISNLAVEDIAGQASSNSYQVIRGINRLIWTDFYNVSNRGVMDFMGNILPITIPTQLSGKEFVSLGGTISDLAYGFEYANMGNDYRMCYVNYFSPNLEFISRVALTESYWDYYSGLKINNFYVTPDKKNAVFAFNGSMWSTQLENGYFKNGNKSLPQATFENCVRRADHVPINVYRDQQGENVFSMLADYSAQRVTAYKYKTYINIK